MTGSGVASVAWSQGVAMAVQVQDRGHWSRTGLSYELGRERRGMMHLPHIDLHAFRPRREWQSHGNVIVKLLDATVCTPSVHSFLPPFPRLVIEPEDRTR